jgi:hypothetical protein
VADNINRDAMLQGDRADNRAKISASRPSVNREMLAI